jgi:hypothetical protein
MEAVCRQSHGENQEEVEKDAEMANTCRRGCGQEREQSSVAMAMAMAMASRESPSVKYKRRR